MKKLLFLVISICLVSMLQAQIVSKTVHMTVAGTLADSLSATDRENITNLTVTGIINAKDFVIIRNKSLWLTSVDLSQCTIVASTCKGGLTRDDNTGQTYLIDSVFEANALPQNAFLGNQRLASIILPSTITSIGSYAFNFCDHLTSIVIPDSVTFIGKNAFRSCGTISSLNLPKKLVSIGDYAFSNCISIASTLVIPSSVTSIGEEAFNECWSVTTIFDSAQTTEIKPYTFRFCKSLRSFNIPSSVVSIGEGAFDGCTNLKSIFIPSSVIAIEGSFSGCGLDSVTIPSSVIHLGSGAFMSCPNLVSVINNAKVTSLSSTFWNCISLKSVNIPLTVTRLGDAFEGCSSLTSVLIPVSVKIIESDVFSGCSSLETVTIPDSVSMNWVDRLFYGCKSLNSIILKSATPTNLDNDNFYKVDTNICTLYVPVGSKKAYQTANQWKVFTHIIEGNGFWLSDSIVNLSAFSTNRDSVQLYSNTKCTVISNQPWLTITVDSTTNGNAKLKFTATENFGNTRIAKVTVSANGKTDTIMVTQDATIVTSWNTIYIRNQPIYASIINVIANSTWIATVNQSWLTITPSTQVTGNGDIRILATNNLGITRTAKVIITSNGVTDTVTVIQDPIEKLEISDSTLSFNNSNKTAKVLIESYNYWRITSDATWLTISSLSGFENDSLLITALPNTTDSIRHASVIIFTLGNVNLYRFVSITQAIDTALFALSKTKISFTDSISSTKIFISANAPWSASSNVSWITLTPSSGTGSDSITITAQANTTGITRTGSVTISSSASFTLKGAVQQTITVTQEGTTASPLQKNDDITLYPNPANSSFTIDNSIEANVEVYTTNSQLVLRKHIIGKESIPVKDIPAGVYVVKIIADNAVVTKRLVVE